MTRDKDNTMNYYGAPYADAFLRKSARRFPRRISINLYDADEKQEYDRHKLKHDKTYFGIPTELNFDD